MVSDVEACVQVSSIHHIAVLKHYKCVGSRWTGQTCISIIGKLEARQLCDYISGFGILNNPREGSETPKSGAPEYIIGGAAVGTKVVGGAARGPDGAAVSREKSSRKIKNNKLKARSLFDCIASESGRDQSYRQGEGLVVVLASTADIVASGRLEASSLCEVPPITAPHSWQTDRCIAPPH